MERESLKSILSNERLKPYLKFHSGNFEKAIHHYKANIEISESFYSMLSVLEIALRNKIDYQLQRKFSDENWFENKEFIRTVNRFQIDKISEA